MGHTSNLFHKNLLLVFEGPDGVGKTTQALAFADYFEGKYIKSPNDNGDIGFIREIILTNTKFTNFERQLLQTLSLTTNLYTEIDGTRDVLVLDRSFISTLLYGQAQGISNSKLAAIEALSKAMWQKRLTELGYMSVIVVFTAKSRYNSPDKDIYESTINWEDLNMRYRKVAGVLKAGGSISSNLHFKYYNQNFQFTPSEYVIHIELDPSWDEQRVALQIQSEMRFLFHDEWECINHQRIECHDTHHIGFDGRRRTCV